jgi:hypothetical protein
LGGRCCRAKSGKSSRIGCKKPEFLANTLVAIEFLVFLSHHIQAGSHFGRVRCITRMRRLLSAYLSLGLRVFHSQHRVLFLARASGVAASPVSFLIRLSVSCSSVSCFWLCPSCRPCLPFRSPLCPRFSAQTRSVTRSVRAQRPGILGTTHQCYSLSIRTPGPV